MIKFRKKPVEVEAQQLTVNNFNIVLAWCGGEAYLPDKLQDIAIDIKTPEGIMRAKLEDWIIKGVKGEFYPCKPDIFEATYEPVN